MSLPELPININSFPEFRGNVSVQFSGGQTSAVMLLAHLHKNGGRLPIGHRVIFCNTGKERPETLDFVKEVAERFGVEIVWLEFDMYAPHKFRKVTYETASRDGRPFEEVIKWKMFLPNPCKRFCTQWLKIKIANRYVRHVLRWREYSSLIGLRADARRRVVKLEADPKSTPGEEPFAPLSMAGITSVDVNEFWRIQRGGVALKEWIATPKGERPGWGLPLLPHQGNCDLCFLKSFDALKRSIYDEPRLADWWAGMEALGVGKTEETGRFRYDRPGYAEVERLMEQGLITVPLDVIDLDRPDCRCTD